MTGKDDKKRREPKGLQRFFRETTGELRRVTWPSRQEAINLTLIVLVVMFVMSIFLWLVDVGATELLSLALGA